jgi:hypothetical protein
MLLKDQHAGDSTPYVRRPERAQSCYVAATARALLVLKRAGGANKRRRADELPTKPIRRGF